MRLGGAWLLLVGATARAQTVEVRVLGAGAPLSGATVVLDSLERRTGAPGIVRFTVGAGLHRIRVRRVGWRPDSLALMGGGADTTVTFDLEPLAAELEDLIVTTNRTARRVEDEALRVEVLDTEEIEEKQLMTPGDIVMMMNETGGVRTTTTNPSLGGVGIRIRGLKGRYTQILADGLPLYGERAGAFGPLQIPPLDLGQVEVIKGAASALFGASALGGVVNLVTRDPEPGGTALLNGTSLGGADAVTFVAGELGPRWRYTALAGLHAQTRQDRDHDDWSDVPGYRRAVVRPRLLWRDERGQSVLVTTGATVEGRYGGSSAIVEQLKTTRVDAGLVGRWRTGREGSWLQVRASASALRHRHRFGSVAEPDRHRTWFGEGVLSRAVAGMDLLGGIAISVDQYRSERFPSFDYRHVVPGVFAQAERDVGPTVLAVSARFDHHNRFGSFVSPRFSALWRAGGTWSLRGSLGLGFFAPTPVVEETERVGFSRVAPPSGLVAERAASAAIDVHGVVGPVEFNGSLFATRVRHPLLTGAPAGLGLLQFINASRPTRSTGADLSVRYRRGELGITASYALVASRELDPDRGVERSIPLTPRHSAGLVAVLEPREGRVGLELYYTGRQTLDDNPYRPTSIPYLLVGILAERRWGAVSLFVNLENLTDVRQTRSDPLVRPPGERGRDGSWTTEAWAPLDGRVVNAGIRWAW